MTTKYTCLVCGYTGLDDPPVNARGFGTYEICASCGFEFGVDDIDKHFTYESWRAQWVADGMRWWSSDFEDPPADWDPRQQLANLLNGSS